MKKVLSKLRTTCILSGLAFCFVADKLLEGVPETEVLTMQEVVAFSMWLAGIVLLLHGGYLWAKIKNRSGWWALFVFISPIGLIVLACLKTQLVGELVLKENGGVGPRISGRYHDWIQDKKG